jgi:hypothetical protein
VEYFPVDNARFIYTKGPNSLKEKKRAVWGARYLYVKRNVEKVWGLRYLPENTVF